MPHTMSTLPTYSSSLPGGDVSLVVGLHATTWRLFWFYHHLLLLPFPVLPTPTILYWWGHNLFWLFYLFPVLLLDTLFGTHTTTISSNFTFVVTFPLPPFPQGQFMVFVVLVTFDFCLLPRPFQTPSPTIGLPKTYLPLPLLPKLPV